MIKDYSVLAKGQIKHNWNVILFIFFFWHVNSLSHISFSHTHPNLPGAVTFDQLEVLAQVVVGAEANFEDLDRPSIPRELPLRAWLWATLSWTGRLPRDVTGHHLIHFQGWVVISIPSYQDAGDTWIQRVKQHVKLGMMYLQHMGTLCSTMCVLIILHSQYAPHSFCVFLPCGCYDSP